ncbi:MAG: hypothetical protein M1586_00090 [Patescibacteria group bacterium]|nr:hypothetical protein [Patescibacteria group bacterium]MCL5261690.1 hypothetical protein [Patescibacteria group bacterium]
MSLLFVESLAIVTLNQAALKWRPGFKNFKAVFWSVSALMFATAFCRSSALYLNWKNVPSVMQYVLPPYQSLDYFLFYAFSRFFAPVIIAFLAAIAILGVFSLMNGRSGERFFEKEEVYFAPISVVAMSYPSWLVYIPVALFAYVVYHLIVLAFSRKKSRLSFYNLWFPIALFVILIIEFWLKYSFWWPKLKI